MNSFITLMYHEIIKREDFTPTINEGICVSDGYEDKLPTPLFCFLDEFEKQMRYLHEQGYTTLTLQQVKDFYYSGKSLPEKAVLLTFDDMFKSVYIYAYPILKKYGFHGVGFVVKDWLFSQPQEYKIDKSVTMSFEEVEKISDVFEFANHTASLHKRRKECTEVQAADEEILYKDLMECETFVNTKGVFAYPFGGYNEQVIENLKQWGYLLGFTTEEGKNTVDTDTMKLHRYGVFINYDINKFMDIFQ